MAERLNRPQQMSEGPIKCKIVSFRVSDDEYEAVKEACRKQGFASVPLFARFATLTSNSSEPVLSPLDAEINRLWRRLDALTSVLERLASHTGVILAPFNITGNIG